MRTVTANRQASCRTRLWLCPWLLLLPAAVPPARAAPPIDRLPAPDYSFDLTSPKVVGGGGAAGAVLALDFPDPVVVVAAADLGLVSPNDDLDALSANNAVVDSTQEFVLQFSVDRDTAGLAAPDPQMIESEVPYNPLDQAAKGQAAGDQYMSLSLYTRTGVKTLRGERATNSTLERNNFDEGGHDFSADPPVSASQNANRVPQDNVDATAKLQRGPVRGKGRGPVVNVYFSATSASPSLATLPHSGTPSGADVFFNSEPTTTGTTALYAAHGQLGLVAGDDIDALIVFDTNENGQFDGTDEVVFSLVPSSPSLDTIPGASTDGPAADVFVVNAGQSAGLFTLAESTGLGDTQDNIDALDYFFCTDAFSCAAQHGIRAVRGDWDDNATVNLDDYDHWPECMTGPDGELLENCGPFDFGRDLDVDLEDFAGFQRALDTAEPRPPEGIRRAAADAFRHGESPSP